MSQAKTITMTVGNCSCKVYLPVEKSQKVYRSISIKDKVWAR